MYKSLIEIDLTDAVESIRTELDGAIYKAVCAVGVTVDKEELEKALFYNRSQYDAGKHDGIIGAVEQIRAACRAGAGCTGCEFFSEGQWHGQCRLAGMPCNWDLEVEQ